MGAAAQSHMESLSRRPYWTSYLLGFGVEAVLHTVKRLTTFHQQKIRPLVVYTVSKGAGLQQKSLFAQQSTCCWFAGCFSMLTAALPCLLSPVAA